MKAQKNLLFTILGLVVLAVSLFLQDHIATATGLIMATGAGMYSPDMQTFRRLLLEKTYKIAWNIPIWSNFMGYIGGKQSMFDPVQKFGSPLKNPKATGMPLEVYEDFGPRKGQTMDIPIYYPLVGKGVSGFETLKGKGERARINTIEVNINEQRHAFLAQDHKMSKQVIQSPAMIKQLFRSANDYLGDWFLRWNAHQVPFAFLEGFSHNLTKAVPKGLGKQKRSAMNTYVSGSGKVTFSATHATYEAAMAAALAGLTNTSADYMSTQVIENLVYVAAHNHKVQPIQYGGISVYPIVISDAAALQLQAEEKWNNRMLNAAQRDLEGNPVFTGRIAGVYARALVLIDETLPSAYLNGDSEFTAARSTTGTTAGVCYGTNDADGDYDYMENPVDPGDKKPAILFGKSAICVGKAQDIDFEDEFDDFKHKHEVGADMIVGYQASDILDTDGYFGVGGNERYENVSSVVAWTYSPSNADWT